MCRERDPGSRDAYSNREDGTLNERDTKLVQWLNEAHVKEAELEADLKAHIALTKKQSYKNRLREHLKETRDHKRSVARRIKKLGGTPSTARDVRGVPKVVGEAAGKAVAGVKGQVGAARALVTSQPDPPPECSGGASRGARRDCDLHESRGPRGGGRGPGHGQAGQGNPARRGAHGEVPRRRVEAACPRRRQGGDSARAAPFPSPPAALGRKGAVALLVGGDREGGR